MYKFSSNSRFEKIRFNRGGHNTGTISSLFARDTGCCHCCFLLTDLIKGKEWILQKGIVAKYGRNSIPIKNSTAIRSKKGALTWTHLISIKEATAVYAKYLRGLSKVQDLTPFTNSKITFSETNQMCGKAHTWRRFTDNSVRFRDIAVKHSWHQETLAGRVQISKQSGKYTNRDFGRIEITSQTSYQSLKLAYKQAAR